MKWAVLGLLVACSGEEPVPLDELPEFAPLGGGMEIPGDLVMQPVGGHIRVSAFVGDDEIKHSMKPLQGLMEIDGGDVTTLRGVLFADLDSWRTTHDATGATPEALRERDDWTRAVFFASDQATQAIFDIGSVTTTGTEVLLQPGVEATAKIEGRMQLGQYTQRASFAAVVSRRDERTIVLRSTEPIAVFAGPEGLARADALEGLALAWDKAISPWAYLELDLELRDGPRPARPMIRTPVKVHRPGEIDPVAAASALQRGKGEAPSHVIEGLPTSLGEARAASSGPPPTGGGQGNYTPSDYDGVRRDLK
jgi:hypothetical protein